MATIAKRIVERDAESDAGNVLQILVWNNEKFTLGYLELTGHENILTPRRNPSYSPCLSFFEANYLLSNAHYSGILTLPPSKELQCYAASLASSALPPSLNSPGSTWTTPTASSAKPHSTSKPGNPAKSSTRAA